LTTAGRLSSMAPVAAISGREVVYLIVVKFQTKPEWTDRWMDLVRDFTESTRAEAGNLWFEWSRSLEDEHTFVLVEAFTDDGAGPHVGSEHFAQAMKDMPQALASTPRIVSRQVEGQGWDTMGELSID
jgi:quinol monooxygenase YgiN